MKHPTIESYRSKYNEFAAYFHEWNKIGLTRAVNEENIVEILNHELLHWIIDNLDKRARGFLDEEFGMFIIIDVDGKKRNVKEVQWLERMNDINKEGYVR